MSEENTAISVTLKGKGAFDPWIVIKGDDPEQVRSRVEGVKNVGLFDVVAEAQKVYGDKAPMTYKSEDEATPPSGGNAWGGSTSSNNQQQSQSEDPGKPSGAPPQCQHGNKVWKNPQNKDWKGWFCPQKQRGGDCSATWVNDD